MNDPTVSAAVHITPVVRLARTADRARWNGYLEHTPDASVYHRWEWGEVFEEAYGVAFRPLVALREARVVGVLPLVRLGLPGRGGQLVSVPYFGHGGAVADDVPTYRALFAAAEALRVEEGARRVELRHAHAAPLTDAMPARTDKVLMRRALPSTVEALLREVGPKVRADVRRPEKEGMRAVVGGAELVPAFHAAYAAVMRDLGSPCHSARLFSLAAEVMRDRAFVVVVQYQGRPIAGGFLVGMNGSLEIPCAGALHALARLRGNMLLYSTALSEAIARGYSTFSFGRSSADSGTFTFKKNWGATASPLPYHYLLAQGESVPTMRPDNPRYARVIAAWQRLPVAVATALGPRIVRHLP